MDIDIQRLYRIPNEFNILNESRLDQAWSLWPIDAEYSYIVLSVYLTV